MSMSCSDVVTICGLFAVQCIYGLYMMFLSALLAAGVPSLFITVVACAASSIVVLPFALALERVSIYQSHRDARCGTHLAGDRLRHA
ncbi:unnamed protein product [Miscanthus lutarioriparius]|uniref:WAT1-related protein n=1 Tax=Miscanthus lutarioriparius TaxID=422564 RepID=A0A811R7V9_9POAL|nr:unnamed protein product [Miscanthus lutarioriparius]